MVATLAQLEEPIDHGKALRYPLSAGLDIEVGREAPTMRRPRVRITVQRLMVAVLVVGTVIGGTMELDRASINRAAYIDEVLAVAQHEEGCRYSAKMYAAQAAAVRAWVAAGAQGIAPGEFDGKNPGGTQFIQPHEADEWRRHPGVAKAGADRYEQLAATFAQRAADHARHRREYERNSCYPWVLFAPDPPKRGPR